MTDALPTTEAEAHRETARLLLSAHHLLRAYAGDVEDAARDLAASYRGVGGPGYTAMVISRGRVTYAFDTGPTGTVRTVDLLRLAVSTAARGAAGRLARAWSARSDALHERPGAPDLATADREVRAAVAAWWDGQPGVQLDLFDAAS